MGMHVNGSSGCHVLKYRLDCVVKVLCTYFQGFMLNGHGRKDRLNPFTIESGAPHQKMIMSML